MWRSEGVAEKETIAILGGTGDLGTGLAIRWAKAGHRIVIGSRTLEAEAAGCRVGVLITDSANRPWRLGTVGIAIGAAGLDVLDDQRGGTDIYGRELKVTLINRADSVTAAATLAMGETSERTPAALVRGLPPAARHGQNAKAIVRPLEEDLFR